MGRERRERGLREGGVWVERQWREGGGKREYK